MGILNLSLFSLFYAISFANILSPGAGAVLAITTGLESGRKERFICALGLATGIGFLMQLSVSGLGVVLAGSPTIFTILRRIGCTYLVWLGARAWRAPAVSLVGPAGKEVNATSLPKLFLQAFMLQVTNPQPLVFFVSILPQFFDPKLAYVPQAVVMTFIYTLTVFLVMYGYAIAAGRAKAFFRSPQAALILRRSCGSVFFVIAGIVAWTVAKGFAGA